MADGFLVNRTAQFVWMLAVALTVALAAAVQGAQAQTQGREAQLTSEQLEILNSLPPDQRDALIDQLLGSGARGEMRTEDQPQFPQTIIPRDPNAEEFGLGGSLRGAALPRQRHAAPPAPDPRIQGIRPAASRCRAARDACARRGAGRSADDASPNRPRRSSARRRRSRNSRHCATASRIGIPTVLTVSAGLKCRSSGRSRSPD